MLSSSITEVISIKQDYIRISFFQKMANILPHMYPIVDGIHAKCYKVDIE